MKYIHLKDITVLQRSSDSEYRESLPNYRYSTKSLIDALKKDWIPYYECHKCGWSDSCPYLVKHPANPNRSVDIQCVVTIKALENFITAWWPYLTRMNNSKRQHLFDAAFHFTQYILDTHLGIGTLVYNLSPAWWGNEAAAHLTSSILYARPQLDAFAASINKVSNNILDQRFVFVEGESEANFLKCFFNDYQLSSVVCIHSLQGKGNAKPSRIPMQLLKKQGYFISIQIDGDNSAKNKYAQLIQSVSNVGGSVFIFKKDFESAFPPTFLHKALQIMNINISLEWIKKCAKNRKASPIINDIESKLGIQINKKDLAINLAKLSYHNYSKLMNKYRRSEISRWLYQLVYGNKRYQARNKKKGNTHANKENNE